MMILGYSLCQNDLRIVEEVSFAMFEEEGVSPSSSSLPDCLDIDTFQGSTVEEDMRGDSNMSSEQNAVLDDRFLAFEVVSQQEANLAAADSDSEAEQGSYENTEGRRLDCAVRY